MACENPAAFPLPTDRGFAQNRSTMNTVVCQSWFAFFWYWFTPPGRGA